VAALTSVPGIGQRSAQKLLLELRPKLDLPDSPLQAGTALAEVREALEGLGYQSAEIRDVLGDLPGEAAVEDSLQAALQQLGKQR